MAKTRHMQARMSQRAINQALVDLALQYGAPDHSGKTIIANKALTSFIDSLNALKRITQTALQKGGVVVVEENGWLITTYPLNSYRRPK